LLFVELNPLFVGLNQFGMFGTLDQSTRFVFGASLKETARLASRSFVMFHPVGSFTLFLKVPATIGLQLLPGRAKV